jgi:hypothetical protein
MTTKLCWNCETTEIEPDEIFCSAQCWKETMEKRDLPMPADSDLLDALKKTVKSIIKDGQT